MVKVEMEYFMSRIFCHSLKGNRLREKNSGLAKNFAFNSTHAQVWTKHTHRWTLGGRSSHPIPHLLLKTAGVDALLIKRKKERKKEFGLSVLSDQCHHKADTGCQVKLPPPLQLPESTENEHISQSKTQTLSGKPWGEGWGWGWG